MDTNTALALIERRASANRFDAGHELTDREIERLILLATRAPTAYNLQNWRFVAVKSAETKARLYRLAHGQKKVADAAVTFIVCGVLPDPAAIPERLRPLVEIGRMSVETALDWQTMAQAQYADARLARDEAVRSASLGSATLMHAAEALGLASGPMAGFDAEGVTREFCLGPDELPVLLVAVGRAAPGNWPQKPRRQLTEVLEIV